MNTQPDKETFYRLCAQATEIRTRVAALLPAILTARRTFMRTRTDADRAEMERLEQEGAELMSRHHALAEPLRLAAGISQEILAELDKPQISGDGPNRMSRDSLRREAVDTTGYFDRHLEGAISELTALLPPDWASEQDEVPSRLDSLVSGDDCLSIVKGLRPESEFSPLHRLRQSLRLARDFIDGVPTYDHFAGATLVPQLARFGDLLPQLREVRGDLNERLSRLWAGASAGVDSTMFELFVAARCVEMGSRIEFIPEASEKSPDLRSHDPFPLVIECKRKRVLTDYGLAEERIMRGIFLALEREARAKGMFGRFGLRLTVEASEAPTSEIVARMISQRLAAHPERAVEYPWGSVAYRHLGRRDFLPGVTRLYSPNMLAAVFGWDSDVPEWDGMVCRVDGGAAIVDTVRQPIALVWNNDSTIAVRRRSWSPLDLFGDAMNQIPKGEFAIVYLAYQEGARAEIADRRVNGFMGKMQDWMHSAAIRVPISFLLRLYPRALNEGQPDMIESAIRLFSGVVDLPKLFEDFPATIFTSPPEGDENYDED